MRRRATPQKNYLSFLMYANRNQRTCVGTEAMMGGHKVGPGRTYGYGLTKQRFCIERCSPGVRKGSHRLVGWLVKTWPKRWPPGSELERLHLSGLTQRKGLRGLGRWECYGGSSFKTFREIPETYLSPPVQSMCEGRPQNP